jgi:hypothetical protein
MRKKQNTRGGGGPQNFPIKKCISVGEVLDIRRERRSYSTKKKKKKKKGGRSTEINKKVDPA